MFNKRFIPRSQAQRRLDKLNSQEKLRLPFYERLKEEERPETPKGLIDLFMEHSPYSRDQILDSTIMENGRKQKTGRARSAEDIYRLCRSYFPEVKFCDVIEYLDDNYGKHYCPNVCRVVYHGGSKGAFTRRKRNNWISSLKQIEYENS